MLTHDHRESLIFSGQELWSDEPPLESDHHLQQIMLLFLSLQWWWQDRPDAPENRKNRYYAAGNLTIYYSQDEKRRSQESRGPDFFVVLDVENRPRRSWTVWLEGGKYPNVIVEILSDSTAKVDRELKKELYQNTFKTPEYFWFDPASLEYEGWRLVEGIYQGIPRNQQGWRWSQELELYVGILEDKLRFWTESGELVPAPLEVALQERERAEAGETAG